MLGSDRSNVSASTICDGPYAKLMLSRRERCLEEFRAKEQIDGGRVIALGYALPERR
jgi:hypothetical protein